MVITDTIEGVVDETLWFHFDLTDDVLYLRVADRREEPTFAEETADGLLALRSERDNQVIGLTIVDFWSRFGTGVAPTSVLAEVEQRISDFAGRLAACAVAQYGPDESLLAGSVPTCWAK